MSNFNANINELKKIQPRLSQRLEEIEEADDLNFTISKNNDNLDVLRVKNAKGYYVHYTSFFNPVAEAKELIENVNFNKNRSLILVIGIGMGYQLDEIYNRLNEKSVVLVLEKDINLLKEVFIRKDFVKILSSEKVRFFTGDLDDKDFINDLGNFIKGMALNIMNIQPVILPVIDENYVTYSYKMFNHIRKYKDTYFFAIGNDLDDTLIGIRNRYDNLVDYIRNPGVNDFKEKYGNIYKNKPAIIVASGPSLNKNIENLKDAKNKALVLACDGSMSALLKRGIIPDVVSSVERIWLTYEAFYKGKTFPNEIVLAAPAVVRPEIPRTFNNKILSFFKGETYGQWFNDMAMNKGTVWSGASVAHVLFGLAHELGCNPIILVGQDLAYTNEGVSHVNEAEVKEKINLDKVEVYVKDENGNDLPSTYVWEKFLKFYEEAVRSTDRKIIDSTEGGAYIKGTELMPLKESIKEYCKEEVPGFRELVDKIDVEAEFVEKACVKSAKKSFFEIRRFNLLRLKAEKALLLNKNALDILNKGINTQEELDRIYDAIDYTEYKITKRIMKNKMLHMLFQYPIFAAASKINNMDFQEYTFETIKENLIIQEELLKIVKLYCRKMIYVIYCGMSNIFKVVENNNYVIDKKYYDLKFIEEEIDKWNGMEKNISE